MVYVLKVVRPRGRVLYNVGTGRGGGVPWMKKRSVKQKRTIERKRSDMECAKTITLCGCGENGDEMEQIGEMEESGIAVSVLQDVTATVIEKMGGKAEIIDLRALSGADAAPEAVVLVIRNGVDLLAGIGALATATAELEVLEPDKHVFSRKHRKVVDGRVVKDGVVNRTARWNYCISDRAQAPDIVAKKGTIYVWSQTPTLDAVRCKMQELLARPECDVSLAVGEANVYYDVSKCKIGWHGDSERRIVVGVRFGASEKLPLRFQAFRKAEPEGAEVSILLHPGDVYVMSEAAVGTDWVKERASDKKVHWRHGAGSQKALPPKRKRGE